MNISDIYRKICIVFSIEHNIMVPLRYILVCTTEHNGKIKNAFSWNDKHFVIV